jgi:hypothetical protein
MECVPVYCLFTSNAKVHVYLTGLYNRATCKFKTAYTCRPAVLLDVLTFLFPVPYQHSSETILLLHSLLTPYDVTFVPNYVVAYGKLFQLLTIYHTHEVYVLNITASATNMNF